MPPRTSQEDHYTVLGVVPWANEEEVRRRYRFLMLAFHPDRFTRSSDYQVLAEERVKLINEAYQVLSDPDRRTSYDRLRRVEAGAAASVSGVQAATQQASHLQQTLSQAQYRVFQLEDELRHLRSRLDLLGEQNVALQNQVAALETARRVDATAADSLRQENQALAARLATVAQEHGTAEEALQKQLQRANQKVKSLSQDLKKREQISSQLQEAKAEWEQSNRQRLDALQRQLEVLQAEVRQRESRLTQEEALQVRLLDKLAQAGHAAERLAYEKLDVAEGAQAEIERLEEELARSTAARERLRTTQRLWQIAAVIGLVNTLVLLLLLVQRWLGG
jgi:curved DNA-binding protein CbpA